MKFAGKEAVMDVNGLQDCFVVFIQSPPGIGVDPQAVERELVRCTTYEEARWVRRENAARHRMCIIRYAGPAGGGD
jgi:hypothetical protein